MATPRSRGLFNSPLERRDAMWGYLFIAAPLLGFLIFSAVPLVSSLYLSLTNYDLASAPKWVGFANWSQALSLNISYLPQLADEASGELLFQCGRETVPASQVPNFEGKPVREGSKVLISCTPEMAVIGQVLPKDFEEVYEINFLGRVYVLAARDPIFWKSLFNTAFMLIGIPISLALSLALAIALNQNIVGSRFFRTVFYIPTILPIAALALIWLWIFNPDFGLLNYLLRSLGLTALGNTNWLQNAYTVKPALIIMSIWRGMGYQMIIFLAGLQGVSRTLYEAAEIDGAGGWGKFRYVTWPSLTPTTFFLLITSFIGALQIFQEPQIMTGGQPYFASTTTVMVIWQNAFRDFQMGYASTQAWLLGVIIMALTVMNFLLARRWVFYE